MASFGCLGPHGLFADWSSRTLRVPIKPAIATYCLCSEILAGPVHKYGDFPKRLFGQSKPMDRLDNPNAELSLTARETRIFGDWRFLYYDLVTQAIPSLAEGVERKGT